MISLGHVYIHVYLVYTREQGLCDQSWILVVRVYIHVYPVYTREQGLCDQSWCHMYIYIYIIICTL